MSPGRVPGMGGLDMTPAGPGDQDTVLGLLRAASSARATSGQAMWGNEFPDVVRDLPSEYAGIGTANPQANPAKSQPAAQNAALKSKASKAQGDSFASVDQQ